MKVNSEDYRDKRQGEGQTSIYYSDALLADAMNNRPNIDCKDLKDDGLKGVNLLNVFVKKARKL